jgi:hypothetical protein
VNRELSIQYLGVISHGVDIIHYVHMDCRWMSILGNLAPYKGDDWWRAFKRREGSELDLRRQPLTGSDGSICVSGGLA